MSMRFYSKQPACTGVQSVPCRPARAGREGREAALAETLRQHGQGVWQSLS